MKEPDRQARDGSARKRRHLAGAFIFVAFSALAVHLFLNQTSVGSPRFVRMTLVIWTASVLVALSLLILGTILGRNLIKLYFERRSGQVGSRFKTKMVTSFVTLSFLPALLLFFLAYGLIHYSIEQWFTAPAEQMMENSRAIADQYYAEARSRIEHACGGAAALLASSGEPGSEAGPPGAKRLAEARGIFLLDYLAFYGRNGELLAESGSRVSGRNQAEEAGRLLAGALAGTGASHVERVSQDDPLQEVLMASAPVLGAGGAVAGALVAESGISQSVRFKAYSVAEAVAVHQQLMREKANLRFSFLLILALSSLLIVFAFSWFAMYLAKRITIPIQSLAEGAAAVAAGRLDYRVRCEAFDELGDLVATFNRMTGDLEETKCRIEAAQDGLRRSNLELDDRRRYIETILQTIGAGVLSIDGDGRIRTMNRAAVQMLGSHPTGTALAEALPGGASDSLRALLHRATALGSVVRNIELEMPGRHLHLATTVTPLVDSAGSMTGWVVVLDDVTELLRVEKLAAWQEVARRMAHEIKNPLTPIQLSAGRILHRWRQLQESEQGAGPAGSRPEAIAPFGSLLEECVQTITQEADSLKRLVDEFSRFARLPEVRLEDGDLHQVIETTLGLYNGRTADVRIETNFDPSVPVLRLDPEQMKRVFINLIDNALEAMADRPSPKVLGIATRFNAEACMVRVEVRDTGGGFPAEYQDSLFLPYFSTRKGGTGLGLAIVRQIITDHRGYIRAEPGNPEGTRILIDLSLG